jgi:chemotaxis signal transduction protein
VSVQPILEEKVIITANQTNKMLMHLDSLDRMGSILESTIQAKKELPTADLTPLIQTTQEH